MIFKRKFWHELFEAGIALKGLNSLWEGVAGLILLLSAHPIFHNWFISFTREEYVGGGRDDQLFRFAAEHLNHLSVSTRDFAGIYLLMHGVLNVFLVYNLYRDRRWAYPLTMGVLGIFLIYQAYRLAHTHSIILICTMIFDLCFIGLTWHEWHYQKHVVAK
jgi:uncharacterized membrane protein